VFSRQRLNGSRRWIAALAVATMLGLAVIVAVVVDGRIVAWSRHIAQSAADAAALAGAASLNELLRKPQFVCGSTPDDLILDQVLLYAELNQIPDMAWGLNVQAYYLGKGDDGALLDLINPETGSRWKVGSTGAVPCEAVRGLHVEVYYPQETLLTRLFGVENATVRMDASATWEETGGCSDYASEPAPAASGEIHARQPENCPPAPGAVVLVSAPAHGAQVAQSAAGDDR